MRSDSTQQQTLWRERIGSQARSGVPMAEFCRQHDLCVKTFYRWRARLGSGKPASEITVPSVPKFLRVQMPAHMLAPRARALLTVRLASGARLSVLDASVIPVLLAALQ